MEENRHIMVTPVEGGWQVMASLVGLPLMFRSGAEAEKQARRLACVIAQGGDDAHVVVHDRRNTLIGTVTYRADAF